MKTADVQGLEERVAKEWRKGLTRDMFNAYNMARDELGECFVDFLDAQDYQSTDDIIGDLDDKMMSIERNSEDESGADRDDSQDTLERISEKEEAIHRDGGPLWDVAYGPEEAENVSIDDFLRLIREYVERE